MTHPPDYIPIPNRFLKDPNLSYGAKMVGMAIQACLMQGWNKEDVTSVTRMADRMHRERSTVRRGIQQLKAAGWPVDELFDATGQEMVQVPPMLIFTRQLTNCAKLLWCQIHGLAAHMNLAFEYVTSYLNLHHLFGMCVNTIKLAVTCLQTSEWLSSGQRNQHAPVTITLFNAVQRKTSNLSNKDTNDGSEGEVLTLGTLNVVVDSGDYDDQWTHRQLINPDTGVPLSGDRRYGKQKVVVEFNGPQHYRATKRFGKETVAKQKRRDKGKKRICRTLDHKVIELTAADLSFEGLKAKLGHVLPLVNPVDLGTVGVYLENRMQSYRERCQRAGL